MRKLGTALSLSLASLAIAAACSSTKENEPSAPETPTESTATPTDPASIAAAGGQDDQDEYLGERFEALSLAEQKQAILVESHLANARELRASLNLEGAEQELAAALELDPLNLEAKQAMAEVGALLGRSAGEVGVLVDTLEQEYTIRVQQLRLQAEDSLRQGKVMLARGDYDAAIAEFTFCLDHIRWAPYSIDWGGLDETAAKLLSAAKNQREATAALDRENAQRTAHQELLVAETESASRRETEILNMLDQAMTAFELQKFDDAMYYAQEALRVDPANERARDISDSAFRADREKGHTDFLIRKQEQYRLWQEQIAELKIPNTETTTAPDRDFWNRITELRAGRRGIDLSKEVSAQERLLRADLADTHLPGLKVVDEESLTSVVEAIRLITNLPLVVDPLAEEAAVDAGVIFTLDLSNPLSVEKVLSLVADMAGEDVAWTVRYDSVFFTTKEKARGELIIYNHDVNDLIFALTDFLGPRIDKLKLLDDLEDDDGSPFGGIGEKPTIITPDDLTELVQANVAVGTWDGDNGVSIDIQQGNMIVVHEPSVQAQVRSFLEDLRRFSSSLVTIESKFMTLEDNWLQEIGVEWRGIDNPGTPFTDLDDVTNGLEDMASLGLDNGGTGNQGSNAAGPPAAGFFYNNGGTGDIKGATSNIFETALGASLTNIGGLTGQLSFLDNFQVQGILRMVEKGQKGELINDQLLSVHNTQRAYVTVVNQQAYVQDFDVEVAQFQAIADPQINVLTEGIVLDVRPTIHQDRKYMTLEVQPTVAEVVALEQFSTTLGSNTAPVNFILPELETQSVFTTVVMPDGGTILLGGLSRIRDIERRAEVPWIANIPIIGFFFKQEGYSDEKQSLMIMIKAWITDVKDELSRLER